MRVHPLAVAALGAVFLLTACSSGVSADTPAPRPATTASLTGKTPEQILAASSTAATSADSVHVKGQITEGGETTKIDMVMSSGGLADGRVAVGGQVLTLRRVAGSFYLKAPLAFWTSQGLGPVARRLNGKWYKVADDQPGFSQFSAFTDLTAFFGAILAPDPGVTLTQVPGKTSRGQATIGLLDNSKDGGTLYVSANPARPVPVALLPLPSAGKAGDKMTFSEWNVPVTVMAPPSSQVLDSSRLR